MGNPQARSTHLSHSLTQAGSVRLAVVPPAMAYGMRPVELPQGKVPPDTGVCVWVSVHGHNANPADCRQSGGLDGTSTPACTHRTAYCCWMCTVLYEVDVHRSTPNTMQPSILTYSCLPIHTYLHKPITNHKPR